MILRWLPIAAGALAGALLAGGVQQLRVAHVKGQLSDLRSEYAQRVTDAQVAQIDALQRARAAEQAITDKEKAAQASIEQLEREARDTKIDRDLRVAAAGSALDELQQQLAAASSGAGHRGKTSTNASSAGQCAPALNTIRVLAELRRGSAARAVDRARFADEAHAAGLSAERSYDSVRRALQQSTHEQDNIK